MAEIILPPEEQEETPQEPELNIDKPTENSKVITIEFEAKKTAQVSTKDTNQQLYTTDTDAWFEFKETTLENANGTYSVVFKNGRDGSIFQRTGDVVSGVAYYKIPEQEIRHAGKWRGQLVYTLENGDTTAREFGYDVKGHILDGKDVREIVVEDFETLMSQLNSMKDNAELELADLVNTAERNELERQQFYESLVEDINDLQENYQELLDTGVLQTNINEKLEALEEEYAPKLTEVTAQLAQTAREAFRKRELEDMSSEVLAAIEGGESTSFNLLSEPQPNSVTTDKTTFAKQGKNLFTGKLHYIGLGGVNNDNISDAEGYLSAIVAVKPNTKYTVTTFGENTIKRLGAYSEYPNSGQANTRSNRGNIEVESLDITTGSNDYYLVANVSMDNTAPSQLQIEEGERTTYEAPNTNIYIDLSDDVFPDITPKDTTFIKRNSKNLFDGELHNLWMVGAPERVGVPSNPTWKSIIVKVEPNSTYSIRFKEPLTRFRVWQFETYPEPNKDIAYIGINSFVDTNFTRLTTRSETKYMMVTVTDTDGDGEIHEDVIVERGYDTNPPYELDTDKIQVGQPKNHFITSHVSGNYEQVGDNMTHIPKEHDDHVGLTYSIWNDMMNDFPDYITKEYMWSEPVDNLPVYKYTFRPPLPDTVQGLDTVDDIEFEKILVISNIHGYERIAAGQTISFFQELVYNWKTSDVLSMLRWNIQFDVFAVYNPYSLQHQQRKNGNEVDLNENFNIKWGNSYPEDHMQYAGPSALSEYENQQFDKYLDEHNDYIFAIDLHQSNSYEMMNYAVGMKTATESVRKMLVGVASQMNQYSKANYPEIVGDDNSSDFFLIKEGGDRGRMYQFLDKKGIPSLIYETSTNDRTMPNEVCYKLGVTTIGNLFLSAVRFKDELKVIEKDFGDW